MIAIKDGGHISQVFFNSRDESGAHAHGNRLWIRGFCAQSFEKRGDIPPGLAANHGQDAARVEVHKNAHIGMSLADTELVDPNIPKLLRGGPFTLVRQMLVVNVLDRIPTDPQDSGYLQDGHQMNQVDGKLSKASRMYPLPFDKGQFGPSDSPTTPAVNTRDLQTRNNRTRACREKAKCSHFEPFLASRFPTFTERAAFYDISQPRMENGRPFSVFCAGQIDYPQSKGTIEQTSGHGWDSFALFIKESKPWPASFLIISTH